MSPKTLQVKVKSLEEKGLIQDIDFKIINSDLKILKFGKLIDAKLKGKV